MTTAPDPKPHATAVKPGNGGREHRTAAAAPAATGDNWVASMLSGMEEHKRYVGELLDSKIAEERDLKDRLYKVSQLVQSLQAQLRTANTVLTGARTLQPLRAGSGRDQ